MSTAYLTGEYLQEPKLRFNASSLQAQHHNARQGLRLYGPYDAQRLAKDRVQCAIIFPGDLSQLKDIVVSGLVNGNGQFAGFRALFRIPLEFTHQRAIGSESPDKVQNAVTTILRDGRPDIFMIITSDRNEVLYSSTKAILLGNGIPG
jgi:hypothetical protein